MIDRRWQDALVWEADAPLLGNPRLLQSFALVWGGAALVMCGIVATVVGLDDGVFAALRAGGALFSMVMSLAVVAFLMSMIFFRNRIRMRFHVDGQGAGASVIDGKARAINRIAAVAGAISGKPGATGVGLLGVGEEDRSVAWSGVAAARFNAERRTITLRNAWRPVLDLYCTPETYDEAARRVAAAIAAHGAKERARRNPLGPALGLTALAAFAMLPLVKLPYPFEASLLAAILTLCFALATIWLVPLMAWPVLAGVAWIAGNLLMQGLAAHRNEFSGAVSSGFERLDVREWLVLTAAFLGLAVLTALAIAALKGSLPCVLADDMAAMTGGDDAEE